MSGAGDPRWLPVLEQPQATPRPWVCCRLVAGRVETPLAGKGAARHGGDTLLEKLMVSVGGRNLFFPS